MEQFGGPRFFVRVAGLEMHPLDSKSRTQMLKDELGIGLCNITKCCTEVCPEEIHITDNAIIPLKERVVDEFYDPVLMLIRKIRGAKQELAYKRRSMEFAEDHLKSRIRKRSPKRSSTAQLMKRRGGIYLPGHPRSRT
jgi:hypothetical protein